MSFGFSRMKTRSIHRYSQAIAPTFQSTAGTRFRIPDRKTWKSEDLEIGRLGNRKAWKSEGLEIVGVLDNGLYQERRLSDRVSKAPRHVLANNFGLSERTIAGLDMKRMVIVPSNKKV
jgi:hypothetical protein